MPSAVDLPPAQLKSILQKASYVKDAAHQLNISVATLRNVAQRLGCRNDYDALAKRGLQATAQRARDTRGARTATRVASRASNGMALEDDIAAQITDARRKKGRGENKPMARVSGTSAARQREPVASRTPGTPDSPNITNEDIRNAAANLKITGIAEKDIILSVLASVAQIFIAEYHKRETTPAVAD